MKLFGWIEMLFHYAADGLFAVLPRPMPGEAALRNARIVSHRGEHDNVAVLENTLPAFDRAREHGVWGIECDLRWTKDLVPVVFHDADLRRLFDDPLKIGRATFGQLRKRFPQIPALSEVLACYGKDRHLMVEIKAETYPEPARQGRILSRLFSGLIPGEDYHFLALDTRLFEHVGFVPSNTCIPVAQLNLPEMSRTALQRHYGGIAGHYLFVGDDRLRLHHAHGQRMGTAYVRSRNSLFREINRGVDWIFSNHACRIQHILDRCIANT